MRGVIRRCGVIFSVGICLRSDPLNFEHIDDGQESNKEEEEKIKQPDRPDKKGDIDPSGGEVTPGRRKEVSVNGGDNNYETLEPHSGIGKHDDRKNDPRILTAVLEPEQLGCGYVAGDHRPIRPPVGSERTVRKSIDLERVSTVPRDEKLHRVGVSDERSCQKNDFAHIVDVLVSHKIMKLVDLTEWNQECENHGKTTKDCARHEVRREDCCMPTGHDRCGEIEGHNAVDREYERSRYAC